MNSKYYIAIPVLALFASVLKLILNPYLGISPDSLDYIRIANELPNIKNSLFPVFYPLLTRISFFFTQNYLFATKIICLLGFFVIFYYPYRKNFFWKELWIICAFPIFIDLYYYSWSETVLLPLIIIFTHLNYEFFENGVKSNFILKNTVLLILMLLTKYSSVGIVLGYAAGLLVLGLYFRRIQMQPLISVLISVIFFAGYLAINKFLTTDFMGERLPPLKEKMNIRYSFFQIIYNLNPITNDRKIFGYLINYVLLAAFSLAFYIPLVKLLSKISYNFKLAFLLLSCSMAFLIFTIISFFTVKIDNLDSRLLMPFVLMFLLSLLLLAKHLREKVFNLGIAKKAALFIIYFSLLLSISESAYSILKQSPSEINISKKIENFNRGLPRYLGNPQ